MPVIQVYRNGATAGVPPAKNDHLRGKRGDVGGWSDSSTRSNKRFLYSVRADALTGAGFALSLTLKHCPETPDAWHGIRRAFMRRLQRMGLLRAHWLTEWQRRGVPHLHGALWFPEPSTATPARAWFGGRLQNTTRELLGLYSALVGHWLDVAPSAGPRGQHVAPITAAVGWFEYLSKHAVRGLGHYQRAPENIPRQWRGRTGRMWGHVGDWPRDEALRLELDRPGFFAYRRMVRGMARADARSERHPATRARRYRYTRGMLRCPDPARSAVRGVSEWVDVETSLRMVHLLAANGYDVQQA